MYATAFHAPQLMAGDAARQFFIVAHHNHGTSGGLTGQDVVQQCFGSGIKMGIRLIEQEQMRL